MAKRRNSQSHFKRRKSIEKEESTDSSKSLSDTLRSKPMLTKPSSGMRYYLLQFVLLIVIGAFLNQLSVRLQETKDWNPIPHLNYQIKYLSDGTPMDTTRKYSYDDFERIFNVKPIHKLKISPEAGKVLKDHDPTADAYYKQNKEDLKVIEAMFLEEMGKVDPVAEKNRFYVKWASKDHGFGLFSNESFSRMQMIGVYAGVVGLDADNTDYLWQYPTTHVDSQIYNLGLDARYQGNYFRFSNHIGEEANTKPFYVPYNGVWNVIYVAVKPIKVFKI